jgi:transcriptional regulator with XRE-family HTH domain
MRVDRLFRFLGNAKGSGEGFRHGHYFTNERLAAELRVTVPTIRRWKSGKHAPDKRHLPRLRALEAEIGADRQFEMFDQVGSVQRESRLKLNVALDEAAAFDNARRFPAAATFTLLPEKKRRRLRVRCLRDRRRVAHNNL